MSTKIYMEKENKYLAKPFTFELANYTISGLSWGDESLPPLIALHGWLDNAATFAKLAPLLADHYYVIAIDLPGHGQSSHKPRGEIYHFTDYITFVFQLLDEIELKSCSLLGHSMGAAVASLAAATFPEKIINLYLLDFIGPLSSSARDTPKILAQHIQEVLRFRPMTRSPKPLEELIQARIQVGNIPEEAARLITLRNVIELENNLYSWSYDPRLKISSALRISEEQVLAFLRHIRANTQLFIAKSTYQSYFHQFDPRMQAVNHLKKYFFDADHYLHFSHATTIAQKIISAY